MCFSLMEAVDEETLSAILLHALSSGSISVVRARRLLYLLDQMMQNQMVLQEMANILAPGKQHRLSFLKTILERCLDEGNGIQLGNMPGASLLDALKKYKHLCEMGAAHE